MSYLPPIEQPDDSDVIEFALGWLDETPKAPNNFPHFLPVTLLDYEQILLQLHQIKRDWEALETIPLYPSTIQQIRLGQILALLLKALSDTSDTTVTKADPESIIN